MKEGKSVVPFISGMIVTLFLCSFFILNDFSFQDTNKIVYQQITNTPEITPTKTTKDIQLEYIENNLNYIQLMRTQLKDCCFSLHSDETMINISSASWKEDELSKLDRLVYFSSEGMRNCPTGWKPLCDYSRKINFSFVALRELSEKLLYQENSYNGIEEDIEEHFLSAKENLNKFEKYLFLKLVDVRKE